MARISSALPWLAEGCCCCEALAPEALPLDGLVVLPEDDCACAAAPMRRRANAVGVASRMNIEISF
jgi:hypothetical protein